jgi:Zinc carboxypeptidase
MRLRTWLGAVAAGALLVTGSVNTTAPSVGTPTDRPEIGALQQADDPLQTPFEKSNGANWTTVAQEHRFLRRLDAASDRVVVDNVGRTVQGRPLQLVQVGHPAPDPQDAAAEGSVAFFVCSVHGDEPSGREACMIMARDLAFTDDPRWTRLLRNTTVLFMTANPDGHELNTRENADGFDINRDYMAEVTPEGRAVTKVIRDWKPDVLNDLHEYGPDPDYYRTDLLHLWPRNRNADDAVYRFAKQMSNDYAAAQVESLGYTAGIYGIFVKDGEQFLQVAGDEQARILRNYAGLQHVVGMLTETANEPLTPEEEADPTLLNRRRVEVQYASSVGTLQMVLEHRDAIARQTAAAAERATQAGADRSGVVYFEGQDNMLPTSDDEVEPEPMCGYQLTAEQLDAVRQALRVHGITWESRDGGAYVSMAQPDQPLIPLLFDARSEYRLLEATVVNDC